MLLEELVFWHCPTKIGVLQILMLSLLGLFEDEPHSFGLARFKRSGILQNQYGGPNVRFWALTIAMQSGLQQCSMRSQNSLEAQMVYT